MAPEQEDDVESPLNGDIQKEPDLESSEDTKSTTDKTKTRRIYKKRVTFSWEKYLETQNAIGCPQECFPHCMQDISLRLKESMKLETVDPKHPWLICMATIMERKSFRLRINFEGYAPCYDFLCNANSHMLLPVNWCNRNQKTLQPPKGSKNSDWNQYSTLTESSFATDSCFPHVPSCGIEGDKFILEALDGSNTMRTAVVRENIDNFVLIQFDDDVQQYKWLSLSSPCIKPIGWSSENNIRIENTHASLFQPLPEKWFIKPNNLKFEKFHKLEAVDQWNPILIRICTIIDIFMLDGIVARLKLIMEGWPEEYAFWVDADSDEIYPPGFCSSVAYPLTLPNEFLPPAQAAACPTPPCRGQGHVKGPRFLTHHNTAGCPYSPCKIEIPDRLSSLGSPVKSAPTSPSQITNSQVDKVEVESKEIDFNSTEMPVKVEPLDALEYEAQLVNYENENRFFPPHVEEQSAQHSLALDDGRSTGTSSILDKPKKPKFCCGGNRADWDHTEDLLERAIYNSVFGQPVEGRYSELSLCSKHKRKLVPSVKKPVNPVCQWSPEDVAQFVDSIPSCDGQIFIREQIDGEAFLLLTQSDIVKLLGVKIGPALKIYHSIQILQSFEEKRGGSSLVS